jgi:hypothetical protein
MKNRFVQLEFGVSCLADVRVLLQAWERHLAGEALADSESSLVHIMVEDRRPGEEVKLCFRAVQNVLHRFLQSLEDQGVKFTCTEPIPGMLILCRIVRDHEEVRVIYSKDSSDPGT